MEDFSGFQGFQELFIMFPSIVIFGRTIWSYQILSLLGIFSAGIYTCSVCKKTNHDDNEAIIFLLVISIGVLIGAHFLYILINIRTIVYFKNNISIVNAGDNFKNTVLKLLGGSVFYGGLLGGILTAYIYVRKKPHYRYLIDIITPAIPLFHFWGRIGCFLGGCCYGIESPFGFTSRHSLVMEANRINRFPVQLAEAFFNFVLFVILDYLIRKKIFQEKLLYVYLLSYSTGRFFIEFLRGDKDRGVFLFLSTSQIVSIMIICIVLLKVFRLLLFGQKSA